MDERERIWRWRARRVDATWNDGILLDGADRMRTPGAFRQAVDAVARPVLTGLARDEVTLRRLRGGPQLDPEEVVEEVLTSLLPQLDPDDGVRMAVVKLQLAVLEAIDRGEVHDLLDEEHLWDREWTDERGLVDFL